MSESVNVPDGYQYLRPRQVEELSQEARNIDRRLQQPMLGADRGDMVRRRRRIQDMLDRQQAPDLSPTQRDAWSKEAKRLEDQFAPEMLSGEVMRKNPSGAVDRNMAWHRKHNRSVARWKNIMRALNKGDDSPNVANIERLRPWRTPADLPMQGAQIEGKTFIGTHPSEAYKEGYDRIFGDPEQVEPETAEETPKPVPQPKRRNGDTKVPMLCGALKAPKGRKMHERHCKDCKSIRRQRGEAVAATG